MKKLLALFLLGSVGVAEAQTFPVVNLTASGYIQNANGVAATPTYNFTGAPTTGVYWANPGIGFSVGASSAGSILSTGWNGAVVATTISASTPIPIGSGGTGNTSGTATINANLTGPITSVGNATSIAAQTGTGSVFVVQNTPTLTTPVIGAATGTSLSVSGQLTSTVSTGTAPLVVSSTTNVANLNASSLSGATFAAPGPIGSGTPGTGAFTTLSASSTVSGTGFSTYLASPPAIGGTSAAAGSFTTLSSTGLYTPSSTVGIKGTTTNDNAQAASIGEWASPTNLTSVSITTGSVVNGSSVSLTAGDWEVWGVCEFVPAGSSVFSSIASSVSNSSGVIGAAPNRAVYGVSASITQDVPTPRIRELLSGTTTVYITCTTNFTVGTMTVNGYMFARRIR